MFNGSTSEKRFAKGSEKYLSLPLFLSPEALLFWLPVRYKSSNDSVSFGPPFLCLCLLLFFLKQSSSLFFMHMQVVITRTAANTPTTPASEGKVIYIHSSPESAMVFLKLYSMVYMMGVAALELCKKCEPHPKC